MRWLLVAFTIALLSILSNSCQSSPEKVQILAEDVEVHLGDQTDLAVPWKPLYHYIDPSFTWQGEFYVRNPGEKEWLLSMDVLQLNEWSNVVRLNGRQLQPGFLPGRDTDWASTWSRVTFVVPSGMLRPELNVLSIEIGQWAPVFQVGTNIWEDIQFRNIILRPRS